MTLEFNSALATAVGLFFPTLNFRVCSRLYSLVMNNSIFGLRECYCLRKPWYQRF